MCYTFLTNPRKPFTVKINLYCSNGHRTCRRPACLHDPYRIVLKNYNRNSSFHILPWTTTQQNVSKHTYAEIFRQMSCIYIVGISWLTLVVIKNIIWQAIYGPLFCVYMCMLAYVYKMLSKKLTGNSSTLVNFKFWFIAKNLNLEYENGSVQVVLCAELCTCII